MIDSINIQELEKIAKMSLADIPLSELEAFLQLVVSMQEVQGIDHLAPLISPGYEEVSFQNTHFLREDIVEDMICDTQYYTVPKIL
jgi:hypothetical protein